MKHSRLGALFLLLAIVAWIEVTTPPVEIDMDTISERQDAAYEEYQQQFDEGVINAGENLHVSLTQIQLDMQIHALMASERRAQRLENYVLVVAAAVGFSWWFEPTSKPSLRQRWQTFRRDMEEDVAAETVDERFHY